MIQPNKLINNNLFAKTTKINFAANTVIKKNSFVNNSTMSKLRHLDSGCMVYFTGLVNQKTPKINVNKLIETYVTPARGCTEPAAIGLAAAVALNASDLTKDDKIQNVEALINEIEDVEVTLNTNVYKNAMYVNIPGTNQHSGIDLATFLGLLSDPEKNLALFESIKQTPDELIELFEKKQFKINLKSFEAPGLQIKVKINFKDHSTTEAIIKDEHTNVVSVKQNDISLFKKADNVKQETAKLSDVKKTKSEEKFDLKTLKNLTVPQMIDIIEANLTEKTKQHIWKGIEMNRAIAKEGNEKHYGNGIGFKQINDNDPVRKAITLYTAAATDVRMSGADFTVMSSVGSGNQGLLLSVPLAILAERTFNKQISEFSNKEKEALIKSVALAHLITAYATSYVGMLSPLCGSTIKGGLGLTAGMSYFMYNQTHDELEASNPSKDIKFPWDNESVNTKTKREEVVSSAIKNMLGTLCGVLCDGAKCECSLKALGASGIAFDSAEMANNSKIGTGGFSGFKHTDIGAILQGFIEPYIAKEGQKTDSLIVDFLLNHRKKSDS